MKLSFYPRGAYVVRIPGAMQLVGEPANYLGRSKRRIEDANGKKAWAYPADGRAFSCDSESQAGQRLKKLLLRDESLWPADKATADYCGVPFVEVELTDGEWIPKPAPSKTKPSKRGHSTND